MVSSCLVGIDSRYDGNSKLDESIIKFLRGGIYIPICPEQLGGLPTPRNRAEIVGGNGFDVLKGRAMVIDSSGYDLTENFIKGANEVLKIVNLLNIKKAILKEVSPSCGRNFICCKGRLVPGIGVTAAILRSFNIEVISEKSIKGG
jgi:uncharacterized protein YbbK (DUF523 family)